MDNGRATSLTGSEAEERRRKPKAEEMAREMQVVTRRKEKKQREGDWEEGEEGEGEGEGRGGVRRAVLGLGGSSSAESLPREGDRGAMGERAREAMKQENL